MLGNYFTLKVKVIHRFVRHFNAPCFCKLFFVKYSYALLCAYLAGLLEHFAASRSSNSVFDKQQLAKILSSSEAKMSF